MVAKTPVTIEKRWQDALRRSIDRDIHVAQVNDTGAWVALSGSTPGLAYSLHITGGIAHGCSCPAAQHGNDICIHRAAWYAYIGALGVADAPRDEEGHAESPGQRSAENSLWFAPGADEEASWIDAGGFGDSDGC